MYNVDYSKQLIFNGFPLPVVDTIVLLLTNILNLWIILKEVAFVWLSL